MVDPGSRSTAARGSALTVATAPDHRGSTGNTSKATRLVTEVKDNVLYLLGAGGTPRVRLGTGELPKRPPRHYQRGVD